jgi:hypothetical protein
MGWDHFLSPNGAHEPHVEAVNVDVGMTAAA